MIVNAGVYIQIGDVIGHCTGAILIGGTDERSGNVELAQITPNGSSTPVAKWFQVCADSFTQQAANLLCLEMGYELPSSWTPMKGKTSEHPWVTLSCRNTDGDIRTCQKTYGGSCSSNNQVKLSCATPGRCEV